MRALVIVALAGCFDPKAPRGLPCSDGWCPPPEMCIAGTCSGASVGDDAATGDDGSTSGPANFMFVTSEMRTPVEIGGVANADAWCNSLAAKIPLPGHYIAWLSSTTTGTSAYARLAATGASGWIRVDGKPFALSMADLMVGKILFPPRVDETGATVVDGTFVGTGTAESDGGVAEDCAGFTTGSGDPMLGGFVDGGNSAWTSGGELSCNDSIAIYCFGTDSATPPVLHPQGTARAFITDREPLGTGPTYLDGRCQSAASLHGITGMFKALVPTSAGAAASRIVSPTPGMPWVRLDGVTVTHDFSSFDAPLDLTVAGTYEADAAWSGAISPTTTATSAATCNFWTSTSGTMTTTIGQVSRAKLSNAFASGSLACSSSQRLYCFESN